MGLSLDSRRDFVLEEIYKKKGLISLTRMLLWCSGLPLDCCYQLY